MMPVRLWSFHSLICSNRLLYRAQTSILPTVWFMMHHLELTIRTRKFASKTLVCLYCISAHRASGSGSEHSPPTETLDSTQHNTPQQHGDLLPCLSGGSSTTAPGKNHTWRWRECPPRRAESSRTRTFWILQSWETIDSYVTVLDFMIWVLFDVPSQGTSKAVCKNSHSLYKLHSSGLSWPAMPPPQFLSDSQSTFYREK